jgi:hypothetical protein
MTKDERDELLDDALSVVKDVMLRDGLALAEIGAGMIAFGKVLLKTSPPADGGEAIAPGIAQS